MATPDNEVDLLHLVGTVVAASQLFETIFVLAARLARKHADIQAFEDIKPVSKSRSFKQPVKALLNELSHAQSIDPSLEGRVSKLVEDRNRVLHRAFAEFGWPVQMQKDKVEQFQKLCARVATESQAMSAVFMDLLLNWMKRFPATSPTALKHEALFKDLAGRIHAQNRAANDA